jgi:hypothetical protein
MKLLSFLFCILTFPVNAQTINSANINIIGNYQNVFINQSGNNHSVNLNLNGDNIPVAISQSGTTPKSFSLHITCYTACANNPTVVNQY